MDNAEIQKHLQDLAEPDFQRFSSALLPGVNNMLGVRLPDLRKLAKRLAREDWRTYLCLATDDSFEEVMLQGMVIGYIRTTDEEWLDYIAAFLPKINNWSVCDSFCSGLKQTRTCPDKMWEFLQPCLQDLREFTVRFGAVMLLLYYIDEAHIQRVLSLLEQVRHPGYYARMAVAWAISICYIKLPDPTESFLLDNRLDDGTFNKAIRKITESHSVEPQNKERLRRLKRS